MRLSMAVSIRGSRCVEIQMQSDTKERRAFLQAVRRTGFEIVSEGDDRIVLLRPSDARFSKLTLRYSLCGQFSEYNNLVVINAMFLDLEDPFGIKTLVEPLNHGATFDVIEHVSIRALPSLDLLRRKRFFKQVSIHGFSFLGIGCGH